MNKFIFYSLTAVFVTLLASCADHDDPELEPIDTSHVKISATVKKEPDSQWLNISEQLTISVSDIKMTAPKGVVLRSVSLVANVGSGRILIDDKPFSGEPMVFKVPLVSLRGRVNFSLRGNLIKQDCRDAEVMIEDNMQQIVFSETPEFECQGRLNIKVKSKSTSGEEYSKFFEVVSSDHFTIPVPQSELYWTPASGTASTLDLLIGSGASMWSPNTTFDCSISKTAIGTSTGDEPTLRITIPNTPGSLTAQKLKMYVMSTYFGTWENVTIAPCNYLSVFGIAETE